MRYILLAFILAASAPQAARAQTAGNHWQSDKPHNAEELNKDVAALLEAVKLNPGNIELYIRLGFAYARLEQADDAQKAFETAARLDPQKAIAHYMLGLIYEKKGLREKALSAWQACLENAAEPRLRETALKHLHHLRVN